MRLINTSTLIIEEFFGEIPRYAILSHTWGEGEVSFQDYQNRPLASQKLGYRKIISSCRQAFKDGLCYCWVDTCCIDKTSSAELSEAINSMYSWYQNSIVCYAYLADVSCEEDGSFPLGSFNSSKWFTRGWTLQELLAPRNVHFYDKNWKTLGDKIDLQGQLSSLTRVDKEYLLGSCSVGEASIAKRMSWMANRTTTRVEDRAYCLLGLFDVNMPLLYGEGLRSFTRLQEEILKCSADQTLFCWTWQQDLVDPAWDSILAPCPAVFRDCGHFVPRYKRCRSGDHAQPYYITNAGLSIWLSFADTLSKDLTIAFLDVYSANDVPNMYRVCVPLSTDQGLRRARFPPSAFSLQDVMASAPRNTLIKCHTIGHHFRTLGAGNDSERYEISRRIADLGVLLVKDEADIANHHLRVWYLGKNVRYHQNEGLITYWHDHHDTQSFGIAILGSPEAEGNLFTIAFTTRSSSRRTQHICYGRMMEKDSPEQSMKQLAQTIKRQFFEDCSYWTRFDVDGQAMVLERLARKVEFAQELLVMYTRTLQSH